MSRIFIFAFVYLSLTSCDEAKKFFRLEEEAPVEDKNVVRTFYKNGKVKSEVKMDSAGKRHDVAVQFYPDGKPKSEITYDHGIKTKAFSYHPNGQLYMDFTYKGGLKHGVRYKYWDSGQLQSSLPYFENEPGTGLEEFSQTGKKLTKYPELKISTTDKLSATGQYFVDITFSSRPSRAIYYRGDLLDGKFLSNSLEELDSETGSAQLRFYVPNGESQKESITIIGRWKTLYGNPYIVKKTISIDLQN